MTFAYADPPYIGQAEVYYSDDAKCAEVNHRVLMGTLHDRYDAWALSMSAAMYSLKEIVPMAPDDARMAAWTKPFAVYKPNVNPAYTWEPVIFYSERDHDRWDEKVKDHHAEAIRMKDDFPGSKPEQFCFWLFDLVALRPEDQFVDMFPGSGAVISAHERWQKMKMREGVQADLELSGAPKTT